MHVNPNLTSYSHIIKRILILRPDNLGDVILFSGALRHIRNFYPNAEITICVKERIRNLIELCPYVDKIILWEDLLTLPFQNSKGVWRLYRSDTLRMLIRRSINRKYKCDLLILPVRSPTGKINGHHSLLKSIRSPLKYGISGDYCNQSLHEDEFAAPYYSTQLKLTKDEELIHELVVTARFLNMLGMQVEPIDIWPEFWLNGSDKEWATERITAKPDCIKLTLCPGAAVQTRVYPAEKYRLVLEKLSEFRFSINILGAPEDRIIGEQILKYLDSCANVKSAASHCGKTSTREFISAIESSDAVLSVESAGLHAGVALRKPTVGIMGGGHFGRFYPWGNPKINRVANHKMDCYNCSWKCKYDTTRCIQEIDPDMIARELKQAIINSGLHHKPQTQPLP